ncbi:cysteine proteinase [Testicularia cyperi]|uniref:Cysteine proteinase n=1 Tax=Testicularia cyperi TaxID=1882483 RepID=A0A317XSV8_9BASI|nr:cysteine proteinase [Testicularia cyperi]
MEGLRWHDKLREAQDLASRATKAELARSYSDAFELYVRAGQTYVWLLSNFPSTANATSSPSGSGRDVGVGSSRVVASSVIGSTDAPSRDKLKATAAKVMARAEKIKSLRKDIRPVQRDLLSPEQQSTVLSQSSLIDGRRYPQWNDTTDAHHDNEPLHPPPPLSPAQLSRKAKFRRLADIPEADKDGFGVKLRGSEIVQNVVTDCSFVAALEVVSEHDHRFGTNLATSALYPKDPKTGQIRRADNGRYHVRLNVNGVPRCVAIDDQLPVYPNLDSDSHSDLQTGDTIVQSRQSASSRLMCATSRHGQATWPALLEKAYLTLMDGYDFHGSDSSIDLHALTGWIPEQIFLRHAGFQREKAWSRIFSAWQNGQVLISAGTGKKAGAGLVSSHDYAVLGLAEVGSRRYARVMNPWSGTSTGASTTHPAIAVPRREADEARRAEQLLMGDASTGIDARMACLSIDQHAEHEDPTFIIYWDDMCSHFDSIYLNWDPSIFQHRLSIHSAWSAQEPDAASSAPSRPGSNGRRSNNASQNPQFRLTISDPAFTSMTEQNGEIWLLLVRHYRSTRSARERASEHDDSDTSPTSRTTSEFIAVHVFEHDEEPQTEQRRGDSTGAPKNDRVYRPQTSRKMGAYVDGTHHLVRFTPSPRHSTYTLVVSRHAEGGSAASDSTVEGPSREEDVRYTLSAFSPFRLQIDEIPRAFPFRQTVVGAWTTRTAGGNATCSSFMNNPQYALTVPATVSSGAVAGKVRISLMLETEKHIPVQVLLAYASSSQGSSISGIEPRKHAAPLHDADSRVTALSEGDVILSSGSYNHGLAIASSCSSSAAGSPGAMDKALDPGTYTVILSTFEPDTLGTFALTLESTCPVTLRSIPQEGAGMYHRTIRGSWGPDSAAGAPRYSNYTANPAYVVRVDKTTVFTARLKAVSPAATLTGSTSTSTTNPRPRPYLNLAVFRHQDRREVTSSGPYTDLVCGVAIPKTRLHPDTYLFVPSTYSPDVLADFTVDLYTDLPVDIDAVAR